MLLVVIYGYFTTNYSLTFLVKLGSLSPSGESNLGQFKSSLISKVYNCILDFFIN